MPASRPKRRKPKGRKATMRTAEGGGECVSAAAAAATTATAAPKERAEGKGASRAGCKGRGKGKGKRVPPPGLTPPAAQTPPPPPPQPVPEEKPVEVTITLGGFLLPKRRPPPKAAAVPSLPSDVISAVESTTSSVAPLSGMIGTASSSGQTTDSTDTARPVRRKPAPKPSAIPMSFDSDPPSIGASAASGGGGSGLGRRPRPKPSSIPSFELTDSPRISDFGTSPLTPLEDSAVAAACTVVAVVGVASGLGGGGGGGVGADAAAAAALASSASQYPRFTIVKDGDAVNLRIDPAATSTYITLKRRRRRGKRNTDYFPSDGSKLMVANPSLQQGTPLAQDALEGREGEGVEFDVFEQNWDSVRPQFTVGSSGAEQSSYLVLDTKCRDGMSPMPAYTGAWGREEESSDAPGIQYEDLVITTEMIGKGAQGSVLRCMHRATKKPLALKRIDLNLYKKDEVLVEAQLKQIQRELSMLFVHHESDFIVKSYNAFYRSNCLLIVFELMDWNLEQIGAAVGRIPADKVAGITKKNITPAGTPKNNAARKKHQLRDVKPTPQPFPFTPAQRTTSSTSTDSSWSSHSTPTNATPTASAYSGPTGSPLSAKKKGKPRGPKRVTAVPEKVVLMLGHQILSGLDYLHKMEYGNGAATGVVHKDIKPSNILINKQGKVKICDFGCAAFLDSCGTVAATPLNVGTQAYMPPERVSGNATEYTGAADVWALGVSLVELGLGCHPFPSLQTKVASTWMHQDTIFSYDNIVWPSDDDMSPEFRDLAQKCLMIDPQDRPSAEELLKHPAFDFPELSQTQKLGTWAQSVMEFEAEEVRRERDRKAKEMGQSLTHHAAARGCANSKGAWMNFRRGHGGAPPAGASACDPDNLAEFPPLGVSDKKDLVHNFPLAHLSSRPAGHGKWC